MIVIAFALLTFAALAMAIYALAAPLVSRAGSGPIGAGPIGESLAADLAEIAAAEADGLLDAAEAQQAVVARQRRALAESAQGVRPARFARMAALAFLGLTPLAVFGLYRLIGAPALLEPQPAPTAQSLAALAPAEQNAAIEGMVARLAARLKADPSDLDGLRRLARAQSVLGRFADARATFQTLFRQTAGEAEDWRNYAALFVAEAGADHFPGGPDFLDALGELDKRAPDDSFVLFFRGGARRDAGDRDGALRDWRRLRAQIPASEPAARDKLDALIAALPAKAAPKAGSKPG